MFKQIPHSKPTISQIDIDLLEKAMRSGMHGKGDCINQFEQEMASYIGVKHARATISGTAAIHLALISLGIKPGDEIILPSYICQTVINAIYYTGATPILADIDSDIKTKGYNISAETIQPNITKQTKAIIVPHMLGIPAKIDKIKDLGIPIIEDCAQAIGATYNGKKVGSFGDFSIFSFYATKMISTGKGGMVLTNSRELKQNIDDALLYDKRKKYKIAYNYDLTNIQSSIGLSQLKQLPTFIINRNKIAQIYNKNINSPYIKTPSMVEGRVYYRYDLMAKSLKIRKNLEDFLKKHGIIAAQPVFHPLHRYLNIDKKNFPNTEKAHNKVLSIPIYPSLSNQEINQIIKTLQIFPS
jgi:perosamine synthetase